MTRENPPCRIGARSEARVSFMTRVRRGFYRNAFGRRGDFSSRYEVRFRLFRPRSVRFGHTKSLSRLTRRRRRIPLLPSFRLSKAFFGGWIG